MSSHSILSSVQIFKLQEDISWSLEWSWKASRNLCRKAEGTCCYTSYFSITVLGCSGHFRYRVVSLFTLCFLFNWTYVYCEHSLHYPSCSQVLTVHWKKKWYYWTKGIGTSVREFFVTNPRGGRWPTARTAAFLGMVGPPHLSEWATGPSTVTGFRAESPIPFLLCV
jgi:hypothetical protein